ncbi:MAG: PQQ-like beta-propeller repeat protein, partial [Treponema sp.]|nr:PQQ-like beta-propeller repeat protein [Treponema sp.]
MTGKQRMRAAAAALLLKIAAAGLDAQTGEMAFTPEMDRQIRVMEPTLKEHFPPGAVFCIITVFNAALKPDEFALDGIIKPLVRIFQEDFGLTLLDGDRARSELGMKPSAYMDKDTAITAASRLAGAVDVFITGRVHAGMFVFEGWGVDGDAALLAEDIDFLTDPEYFKAYTGTSLPDSSGSPVASPRFSDEPLGGCWDAAGEQVFVFTSGNTVGAVDTSPSGKLLWEKEFGERIYDIDAAGSDPILAVDTGILALDGRSGEPYREIPLNMTAYCIRAAQDGSGKIFAGTDAGLVEIDYASGTVRPFGGVTDKITKIKIEGETLAVLTQAGIRRIDRKTGQAGLPFGGSAEVKDFVLLSRQKRILTVNGTTLSAYSLNGEKLKLTDDAVPGGEALMKTPHGHYVYATGKEDIVCFEETTKAKIHVIPAAGARFLRPSPDGTRFISGGTGSTISLHEMVKDPQATLVIKNSLPSTTVVLDTDREDLSKIVIAPHAEYSAAIPIAGGSLLITLHGDGYINTIPNKTYSVSLNEFEPATVKIIPDIRPRAVVDTKGAVSPASLHSGQHSLTIGYQAGSRNQSGGRSAFVQKIKSDGELITLRDTDGATHTQSVLWAASSGEWDVTIAADSTVKVWKKNVNIRNFTHSGVNHADIDASGAVLTRAANVTFLWTKDGEKPTEIPGSWGIFLDNGIAVIAPGGKAVSVFQGDGTPAGEFTTGRNYPLSRMEVKNGCFILVYRDDLVEVREADFSLVASQRGQSGSVGGQTFAVVSPQGIAVMDLSAATPVPRIIPWTNAKNLTVNESGRQIVIMDQESITCINLEGKLQWQHSL